MKRKILFFLQSGVGGAERVSVTIGKSLDPLKFEVSFFSVGDCENRIEYFIPKEIFRRHLKMSNPLKLLIEFFRIIRREKPDVVFSSVMNINTKILLLKYFFRKCRFIIRCDNNYDVYTFKQKLMIKLLYRKANFLVAQTEEMRIGYIAHAYVNENQIFTLQNPLDETRINAGVKNEKSPFVKNENKHFVASGRFAHAKGFDILIAAFAELKRKEPNIDLYILGAYDGENDLVYQSVQLYAKSNGIESDVHCVGFLKNPYPFVKYCDCFVLSSRYEGLPNVLIEALYLGTPVAATKCVPVISRIVDEGKNGFLAEKENVISLAYAMENAMKLGRIESSYTAASKNEFKKLFE